MSEAVKTNRPLHVPHNGWLAATRVYLAVTVAGHLLWEMVQLPLYTIWRKGTPGDLTLAVVHCTAGDLLIALSTLIGALVLAGHRDWPSQAFGRVAALAVLSGLAYTSYSEWLNVVVRQSWAYSDHMPVIPLLGFNIGLSPLLQWVVVPAAAFSITRQMAKSVTRMPSH